MGSRKIAVIGGGAAGFFAAIRAAEEAAEVTLFERSGKLLSKVAVSGGGRCNVTHACFEPAALSENYPRGSRELKKAFYTFQARDTVEWFRARGVKLKTEDDGRMFPTTDDSGTIIDCLLRAADKNGVRIMLRSEITAISPKENKLELSVNGEKLLFDSVIAACGGSPKAESYHLWTKLGHSISEPVPSLFTFNVPADPLRDLAGIAVPATVKISGSNFSFSGPLLITHWGFSGPAVLKLSAWAARWLHEKNYHFDFTVNWLDDKSQEEIWQLIAEKQQGKKNIINDPVGALPKRLWLHLVERAGLNPDKRWAETGKKDLNRLHNTLAACVFSARGKTTFKEEFVTCGGIRLSEINLQRMESRIIPGLFFAGEMIDVDGITGGFNFQNAWTTGWIAGGAAAEIRKH